jgi:hypothetical protein
MLVDRVKVQSRVRRRRSGFPLASLVLLITVCACLLACIDVDRCRQQVNVLLESLDWSAAIVFGGAATVGGIVGLVFSLLRRLSWQSVLLAPVIGICAGEVGALILLAPSTFWRTILSVCVLLTTIALLKASAE